MAQESRYLRWQILVNPCLCVAQESRLQRFFQHFFSMKNQKFASHEAYTPADFGAGRSFDTLSRILVTLMCASVIFFALLFFPVELSPLMEKLTGWCVAGLVGALVCIVVVGLIEQLAD